MAWIIQWGIALAAALCAASAQAQPLSENEGLAIDAVAAEAIDHRSMPGLAIAIRSPDGTITSHTYGVADIDTGEAVDDSSVFRLGSISKLMTAAVIMKLVEDGRLALEQPVREILQSKYGSASIPVSVTLLHLLNHTSGLPDYTREELEEGVKAGFFTQDRLVTVLQRPAVNQAGEAWRYSDANYSLVSVIIEHVTGLSYDEYIEKVFGPTVGLASLKACDTLQTRKVTGYLATESGFVPEPAYEVRGLLGSGGLCSTASDLAELPARLIGGEWVNPEALRRMLASTVLEGGVIVDYGLGVRGGILGDNRAWGHTGGGLHGAWATIAQFPDKGYSIAVVANGTGSELDASVIHSRIARIMINPGDLHDLSLSETELEGLSGAYSRGARVTCIFVTDGKLHRRQRAGSAASCAGQSGVRSQRLPA